MTTSASQFYERLHDMIAEAGEMPFWRHHDEAYSYRHLYDGMLRINTVLLNLRAARVIVYSGKAFPAYAAIYATLLSGNVWVPADPEIPPARNLEVFSQVLPAVVLSDRPLPQELEDFCREIGARTYQLAAILDSGPPSAFALKDFDDDGEAYIMFTSGSTGKPKGVPMSNRNYINFIDNAMRILPLRKGDVFADYHYFGFDISIFYLFCAVLVAGSFAPLILPADRMMPLRHLQAHKVTVLATVPSLMTLLRRLAHDRWEGHRPRIFFICGEPFRTDLLDYLDKSVKAEHVYNFYGLTETGVENFYHECQPGDAARFREIGYIPIGRPLQGSEVRLDANQELLLAGCQLTAGYLGGRSADRFFEESGVRWYRTGDKIVEQDGLYFCKGRLDNQVKLRGYRIELMDVEAQLRNLDGIDEAVCFVVELNGRDALVAALHGQNCPAPDRVRLALKERLPTYMIPDVTFELNDLPANSSGKIDRVKVRQGFLASRGAV